jgi:uncharacterized protein (DUF779 family)
MHEKTEPSTGIFSPADMNLPIRAIISEIGTTAPSQSAGGMGDGYCPLLYPEGIFLSGKKCIFHGIFFKRHTVNCE